MDNVMYNTIPYEVKKGENLTKIARKMGTSVQSIIKANPELRNPDKIFPGQELRVPIPDYEMPFLGEELTDYSEMGPGFFQRETSPFAPQLSRYSHPAESGPNEEQIMQQLLMGGSAGALPMAAAAGPGALTMLGRGLAGLPRMTQPGQVVFPTAKGAVDWPGAARAMSNIRPYPPTGGMPASRAAAQGILNQRPLSSGAPLLRGAPPSRIPPSMLNDIPPRPMDPSMFRGMPPGGSIPPSMLNGMPPGRLDTGILELLKDLR